VCRLTKLQTGLPRDEESVLSRRLCRAVGRKRTHLRIRVVIGNGIIYRSFEVTQFIESGERSMRDSKRDIGGSLEVITR
jgi:hypothetical protein